MAKIAALFGRQVGDLNGATRAARLGMFPHHANVPHGLRLAIEHAMKEGLIRFVICTSTLAQGVNLPIKYLIVTSVYQGIDRIKVRDFHNLIGRAGRAGMHTEGSVIFSQNEVFDGRLNRTKRWRWNAAKELLNPANSEPCASSILLLFDPFIYGNPPQSFALTPASLHRLALFDRAAMDRAVTNALRTRPEAKASDFRHFLEVRAHILHSISAFILAHLDFDAENLAEDAELLCSYTLAYHLADTGKRVSLQTVFRNLALYLVENAPAPELRLSMRRSPLSPASVRALSEWVSANIEMLREAAAESTLLDALSDQILTHTTSDAILALSDRTAAIAAARLWLDGQSFEEIHAALILDGITIGGRRRYPKVEDVVGLCEGGLGYDAAMFISTIADLAEPLDEVLAEDLANLQKRLKYGLSSEGAVAFYELGFADRIVSETLAHELEGVSSRGAARILIVGARDRSRQLLDQYPAYFNAVLDELAG